MVAIEKGSAPIERSAEVGLVIEVGLATVGSAMVGSVGVDSKIPMGSVMVGLFGGTLVGVMVCSPSGSSSSSRKSSFIYGK